MYRGRRRIGALVAAALLALGAAGCGDDDDDDTSAVEVDEGDEDTDDAEGDAAQVTVNIDGTADDFNISAFGYFPSKVEVHAGDTVVYESVFTGEPHSITFGTLVTDAVEAFRSLTPEQLESEEPVPEVDAAFEKLPAMLPEGPGDANQISVNPCFVASGDLPADGTKQCDVTEPEPFTGTETFYNSGFLPDGETFELQLADDIAPGTYVGFCMLHFTEMISEVTVVADDAAVPSADAVAEAGQSELDDLIAKATPVYESREEGVEPNTVKAGLGSEEARALLVTEFAPDSIEVAAGDEITWAFTGPHTISFNAPEDARVLLNKGDDGGYHLNEQTLAPAGFEAPPPPEGEPEGPPPPIEGGTWDGTGFFSSGLGFDAFTATISEPGTYEYVCLIHPEMEGTVTVS